ncbi:MarR family transcriptional regulator [Candidatus Woesearchaeota archaeon]|nr:MarR family transcriptional regulator [Candidatus Woesearchaeota archaeon]
MFTVKNAGYLNIALSILLIVMLSLIKADIDTRDTFLCQSIGSEGMAQCPAHTSNTSWFILISFTIAILILGSGLYLIFMPKNIPKKAKPSRLDHEEKRIYDLLKASQGSLYQSDLIKETGWTKVKMTRILDRLEQKGIIDRKRRGMTNIVVLR